MYYQITRTHARVFTGLGSLLEPFSASFIHPLLRKILKIDMFRISSLFTFETISHRTPLLISSEPGRWVGLLTLRYLFISFYLAESSLAVAHMRKLPGPGIGPISLNWQVDTFKKIFH